MKKFPFISSLLCLFACFTDGAIDQQVQQTWDLEQALYSDTYQTLTVAEKKVLVLINQSTTPITRGVAVMIGESGRSIASRNSLFPLSQQLNKLGWVTMIMPALPLTANSASVLINAEQFVSHEQQLILQMQAIVDKTDDYPGFFLVIAQGTSAAWLAKIYAEEKLAIPDAFVAVSPYWPSREYNIKLADYLANTTMPVLDIYNDWDNAWSLQSYPARQIAADKALKLQYRQREIIGLATENQQPDYLGKEIYGWLSYMGW